MTQRYRVASGGAIDRSRTLHFRFDGEAFTGHPGDTLASALLANGVRLMGRSFKYHRPRGVMGIGNEEPNALIRLGEGARAEPNLRATNIELYDGLVAESQNRWPSLRFDVGAASAQIARLLPAGFYYKTFMWPRSWWMRYEHFIRHAAGLGRVAQAPDPDVYAKRFAHCDVLVVGAGPTGLMAAKSAASSGARVMLVDDGAHPGGSLLNDGSVLDGLSAEQWANRVVDELSQHENVKVLMRANAFGYYDQNLIAINERVADHLAMPPRRLPRQRVWWVRAGEVVLATGAIERPIVFPGNDLPGVMLASAAGGYAHRFAARAGERAVLFTNNDAAYAQLPLLTRAGVKICAVVDVRSNGPVAGALAHVESSSAPLYRASVVCGTRGGRSLSGVWVSGFDGRALRGPHHRVSCDLLCVSGGYNPTVHLFSQSQGRLRYDCDLATFVPDVSSQRERSAGASRGVFNLDECLADGARAGADAAKAAGYDAHECAAPDVAPSPALGALQALWEVPRAHGNHTKCFVDFQNDVTSDDVRLAARENYQSVEHLKRYTTLGMGTDQGRTSNVNGLAIMAEVSARSIPEVGTTTFRAPYAPVTLGALAGMEVGDELEPLRRTPLHDWHLAHGGVMQNVGLWQRCRYYRRDNESMAQAVDREATHVRHAVGLVDVSTFGKIDIQGPDAAEFLERVCINRFHNLKVGRCRYHVMLREDGFIMDDGTTTRVDDTRFYMTTTTAAAGQVMSHLEFYAQTVWRDLRVQLTSVSDQWAGLAIAGPAAREVLDAAVNGSCDVSNQGLPFMASVPAHIAGAPVRIFRITFSGELGYELHMPSDYAVDVWERVFAAGKSHDIALYGTEAMAVMRIEKGHVVHAELDGRTTLSDFGFDRFARREGDFVGRRALQRDELDASRRARLVGLESVTGKAIPAGAHLVWNPTAATPTKRYGHVSSTCYSANLKKHIALALLDDADNWQGRTLYAVSPLKSMSTEVRITSPVFIDEQGARARG